jgi:hypothetical protein
MNNKPFVQNANDRGQVEAARKKEATRAEQQKLDLQRILEIPEGRRVMWRFLEHCGVYRSIFEPNSRIAYNSGMQDVGHFIQGAIFDARPDALLQMMKEAQEIE